MARRSDRDRTLAQPSLEFIFDGVVVTTTGERSACISLVGHGVSATDVDKVLVIRGGERFVIGTYEVKSADSGANTWTLDRPCTTGAAIGLIGKVVHAKRRSHKTVPQYRDENQTNNPGTGETRQRVLEVLNLIEPAILKSLAEKCCKGELLEPQMGDGPDWPGPVVSLLWGHIRTAGDNVPPLGIVSGNLKPLRVALIRWGKGRAQWALGPMRPGRPANRLDRGSGGADFGVLAREGKAIQAHPPSLPT
jgi:hypothetical protein